jgi:hypothetical protein
MISRPEAVCWMLPPSSWHEPPCMWVLRASLHKGVRHMRSDAYLLHSGTEIGVRPPSKQLLACRHPATGAGVALALSCKRRRTERAVVHHWCDHCGTNHRNQVVADECIRLLVNGPDWPDMSS